MKRYIATLLLLLTILHSFNSSTTAQIANNFPGSANTQASLGETANTASSTLASGINSSTTGATLADASRFTATGVATFMDTGEIVYFTRSGNILTIVRGVDGSTAAPHSTGAQVAMLLTSGHMKVIRDTLIAHELKIGTGSDSPVNNEFFIGTGTGTSGWRAITGSDIPSAFSYTWGAAHTFNAGLNFATKIAPVTDKAVAVGDATHRVTDVFSTGLTGLGGVELTGASFKNAFVNAPSSGTTDIYTAPSGKKAMILAVVAYNGTIGTPAWYTLLKSGGNYYQLEIAHVAPVNGSSTSTAGSIILDPGESLAFNATTAAFNVWAKIVEFDSTVNLKSVKLTAAATGNNTIYTVPSGVTAIFLTQTLQAGLGGIGGLFCANFSGGARTVSLHAVPSGGTPGTANKVSSTIITSGSTVTIGGLTALGAGDFVVVNVDDGTPTQIYWINVIER